MASGYSLGTPIIVDAQTRYILLVSASVFSRRNNGNRPPKWIMVSPSQWHDGFTLKPRSSERNLQSSGRTKSRRPACNLHCMYMTMSDKKTILTLQLCTCRRNSTGRIERHSTRGQLSSWPSTLRRQHDCDVNETERSFCNNILVAHCPTTILCSIFSTFVIYCELLLCPITTRGNISIGRWTIDLFLNWIPT